MFIELKDSALAAVDPELLRLVEVHGPDGYRLYVEDVRWPGGPECPRCESADLLWLERRAKYNCRGCNYQFRVTAGTVFHNTHLSIRKWLIAVALMLSSDEGISAVRLAKVLGGSYKTAWFLEHRIRAAMGAQRTRPAFPPASAAPPRALFDGGELTAGHDDTAAPPLLRLLQPIIAGDRRNPSVKYVSAYWGEAYWRDANRSNPNAFRDTVTALMRHPSLTYSRLVTSGAGGANERDYLVAGQPAAAGTATPAARTLERLAS